MVIISKNCFVFSKVALLTGNGRGLSVDYLLVLMKTFQYGWLKITFLGEAETAFR